VLDRQASWKARATNAGRAYFTRELFYIVFEARDFSTKIQEASPPNG
jgi:hypothetical protein